MPMAGCLAAAIFTTSLGVSVAAPGGGEPDRDTYSSGTSSSSNATAGNKSRSQLTRAQSLVKAKKWVRAEGVLAGLRRSDARNPEVWNLSGYVARNRNDTKAAGTYYRRALSIDNDYRAALEYQGHLFLTLDQARQAKRNLRKLRNVCGTSCAEYRSLNKAIRSYQARP